MRGKTRKQVEEYAKSFRWTSKDYYWKHTLQVRDYALMIQKRAGGDKDIVELAALLHDIGKAELLAPGHEKISAQLASKFLKKLNVDEKKINKVLECIMYEDFTQLETRILRSADSMSLIMDSSGGKEWFFKNVLKKDKKKIVDELKKSYSEVQFDFAKALVRNTYESLLKKYST